MKTKKMMLLLTMLAMVASIGSYAVAQVAEDPLAQGPEAQEKSAGQEPAAQEGSAVQEPAAEASCADLFRAEQEELAQSRVYPTSVSEEARACEDSGETNPYPAPYFYDPDGVLYILYPLEDAYFSSCDETAGVYNVYDLAIKAFYTLPC